MAVVNERLFQYSILYHPTEVEKSKGVRSKILVGVQNVLGLDKDSILMTASMEIPAEYKDKLAQIEIVIRPF